MPLLMYSFNEHLNRAREGECERERARGGNSQNILDLDKAKDLLEDLLKFNQNVSLTNVVSSRQTIETETEREKKPKNEEIAECARTHFLDMWFTKVMCYNFYFVAFLKLSANDKKERNAERTSGLN